MADENETIKIKCPRCDKEFGVSPNAFDYADTVKITCYDGTELSIKMDRPAKTLEIRAV